MENGRRFRGIVGIATTWGIALSVLATGTLAIGLATGLVPTSIFGARELVAVAVRGLLAGGVAGGLFGWLLGNREREHALSSMSMRRVALWGFVAGGSLPVILALAAAGPILPVGVLVAGTALAGGLGSILSTATLRMARRDGPRLNSPEEELGRLTP